LAVAHIGATLNNAMRMIVSANNTLQLRPRRPHL